MLKWLYVQIRLIIDPVLTIYIFFPQTRSTLEQWGMNLTPQLVEVEGRILPGETINMANNVSFGSGPDVDWTKNLRSNQMLVTVSVNKWVLAYPMKLENQAKDLFRLLQQVGGSMKFNLPTPERYALCLFSFSLKFVIY